MIKTFKDYKYYLEQDRKALSIQMPSFKGKLREFLFPHEIWRFQKLLRKSEYYENTSKGLLLNMLCKIKLRKQSLKLNFSIPLNVCGPGLSIAHYGTIVISEYAKIGSNCRIHAGVNIGASAGRNEAPKIGDNVYIGPGAILFGNIKIANNVTIGANATVNKDFDKENTVIAGNPAVIVKEKYLNWVEFNNVQL